jgi:nucleoside 2-deoxyribosyltransferase
MDPMRMWFLGGPIFQESEEKKREKKNGNTIYFSFISFLFFYHVFISVLSSVILSTYKLFLFDLTKD